MENANHAIKHGRMPHLWPRDGQDIADEHVFQMLGFACGLAHSEDSGCRGNDVGDPDECFLRNPRTPQPHQRENGRTEKGKSQADPVGCAGVRVESYQDADRCPECSKLCQRQVYEDDAAFDYVHTEIGVNAWEDQTRYERRQQVSKHFHSSSLEIVTSLPGTL